MLLRSMEEVNLLKTKFPIKLSLNYRQNLAGNLSQLLLVCLTDAGCLSTAWIQGSLTMCHALALETTNFHCFHAHIPSTWEH